MFGAGHVAPFAFAGICIALVLVVLGAVLGVTSLGSVKARMSARAWTKVQKWAYAFYALTFLHIVAMLAPSASAGGVAAVQGITVYSVVFVGYAVARIARVSWTSAGLRRPLSVCSVESKGGISKVLRFLAFFSYLVRFATIPFAILISCSLDGHGIFY